jgi:HD-GYP domain-containing protein (c-di-GMP phosphodiesterase class II)
MLSDGTINLLDMVVSVSNAIDLVSPEMGNHHKRVAYIALAVAREMQLSPELKHDLILSGLLHDIGALSREERRELTRFDDDGDENIHAHGEGAYLLLHKFRHFANVANVIRFHHVPWSGGEGRYFRGEQVPMASHILHLADRVDVLVDPANPILGQVDSIAAAVSRQAGSMFEPELVEAFLELAWKEYFWLDLTSPSLDQLLRRSARNLTVELDWDDLQDFAELMAHIIDFRSRFTATHSSGVAAVSAILANIVGFSVVECEKLKVAGHLHDVGKLAIPTEILEKPSRLSADEYRIIKSHAYHTYRILEPIAGLADVTAWASLHHERLDGNGYPARRPGHQIPLGARIIAVADVFTALSEDRPYRQPSPRSRVVGILEELAKTMVLDRRVIGALLDNYDEVDLHRRRTQDVALQEYAQFVHSLNACCGEAEGNLPEMRDKA